MFNYITVEFPGTEVPPQRVYQFSFKQARGQHEMVTVSFRDWDSKYKDIKPGNPVRFNLTGAGGSREFIGYIHNIIPAITPGKQFVTMTFIGASYSMKTARQRTFTNTTASEIVKQIASENSFSYAVEDHPRVFPQVSQAGYTDMELMGILASKCGYSLRLENKTVYFRPLTYDYTYNRDAAGKFTMRSANDPKGSTLYSFNAVIGESMTYEEAYKAAVAVVGGDQLTGKIHSQTPNRRLSTMKEISQPEFFDAYATDITAPTTSDAKYEAEAIMERNRFPYRATVSVIGSPLLRPDVPIYLQGIGPEYSGYWIVLEAEHIVMEESTNVFKYITNLIVGTDSVGSATIWSDNRYVGAPPDVPTRSITPNVRNKYISPTYSLVDAAVAPNIVSVASGGKTKNRPQPIATKDGAPTYVIPYWIGHERNLNLRYLDSRRPPAVIDRLARKNAV